MRIIKQGIEATIIPDKKIDISNSNQLKEEFLKLIEDGINLIIFDFNNVTMVDSSGLGKLLLFQKKLSDNGGKLKIKNISSDYVKKMFIMIHLNKVIDIEL